MRHCLNLKRFLEQHIDEVALHGLLPALQPNGDGDAVVCRSPFHLFVHAIATIFKRRGIVVLCTQANHVQCFLALAARLRGRPLIYDMQDPVPESFVALFAKQLPRWVASVGHAWLLWSESIICRLAAIICVVSPGMRQLILARRDVAEKLFLFPNLYAGTPAPRTESETPTIVFAGGLQPLFRGIEVQIEALRLPLAQEFRLILAGEGERAWVEEYITRSHLSDRVQLLGFLSAADVSRLLAQAHFVVIENLAYGLPSKFFEAVAAGVVVISPRGATDVNAILGDAAIVYDGSAASLASALRPAWQNLSLLRERQRSSVERFLADNRSQLESLGRRVEMVAQRSTTS